MRSPSRSQANDGNELLAKSFGKMLSLDDWCEKVGRDQKSSSAGAKVSAAPKKGKSRSSVAKDDDQTEEHESDGDDEPIDNDGDQSGSDSDCRTLVGAAAALVGAPEQRTVAVKRRQNSKATSMSGSAQKLMKRQRQNQTEFAMDDDVDIGSARCSTAGDFEEATPGLVL